ncbi:putative Thioredoxin-like superfamily [Helianthus debilis subsp. tardiflorus]
MKQGVKIAKFGSIIPISGSNFVHEVSQASSDVWVVVVLYKDGYPECGVLMQCVKELATMYQATKFVKSCRWIAFLIIRIVIFPLC